MRRSIAAAACAACLWTAQGAGMPAPFGVRLGEKLLDAEPALTSEILEQYVLTNGLREVPFGAMEWRSASRSETVELTRPLMGVSRVAVDVDQNGVAYEFSVRSSFRRGLAREESLKKIEALRRNVERECGFRLNDYAFANPKSNAIRGGVIRRTSPGKVQIVHRELTADTVGGEGRGPELWCDIDCVAADSVTTHDGMRVSIRCDVNMGNESDAAGSPVNVAVEFLLVDLLRKSEDRSNAERRLLSERKKAADTARVDELFGVVFGEHSRTPTNELTKADYTAYRLDDNGKAKSERNVHFWKRTLKCAGVPFVNELYATYSLKTRRPCSINGVGKIPGDVDRQEAMRRCDEFAMELNKRYGIAMSRSDMRHGGVRRVRGKSDAASEHGLVRYTFHNSSVRMLIELSSDGRTVAFSMTDVDADDLLEKEGVTAPPADGGSDD